MIKRILIANRGEIAVRVVRTCKDMGIETVAVYSECDKYALHTQMADIAVCIGPNSPRDSYLNMKNIISAAVLTGAEAIHPGFVFLSENSKFVRMCNECNIIFIGPDADSIDMMGDKAKAKEAVKASKIPVIEGSIGKTKDVFEAQKIADEIGYPIMIKAAAGGGGRGMRLVFNKESFKQSYETARAEAAASFSDDSMYIEKFIENPSHIEVQILADNYGNVVYLGERDCSIQRRNQKVLEEAPSIKIDNELRRKLGETAVKAAKAVNYKNAGTIEFLLDKNRNFYFMEMNTRIQVEHPVTEMTTGIDIVKEQIKIASGEKLEITQKDVNISGHAIECRINAEDPDKDFKPCPGTILNLNLPGGIGVRVDSCAYSGYTISPFYDSMVAKLIVHGANRNEAIARMKRALSEFVIEGIETNIEFQKRILENESYVKGDFDTSFLQKELK